ncbi:hypothetical protein AAZX31_01G122800 [Glycine max]
MVRYNRGIHQLSSRSQVPLSFDLAIEVLVELVTKHEV